MSKELIAPFMRGPIETFCQLMAKGGLSQADAFIQSHPKSIIRKANASVSAARLMQRAEVRARIEEIRAPAVAAVRKKIKYELEDAFEELEKAYGLALAQLDPKAMKSVIELKAKLAGLVIARSEKVSQPLDDATTDELLQLRAALKRQKLLDAGEPILKAVAK